MRVYLLQITLGLGFGFLDAVLHNIVSYKMLRSETKNTTNYVKRTEVHD